MNLLKILSVCENEYIKSFLFDFLSSLLFQRGQIYQWERFTAAIEYAMNHLIEFQCVQSVLDLSEFNKQPAFNHIIVNLGNKWSLKLLFNVLNDLHEKQKIFGKFNGVRLAHNNIRTLVPMPRLIKFDVLDVSWNNVRKRKLQIKKKI